MEGIEMTTSETGIHGNLVAVTNETDGMPVGETEKKTGVGMTGTGGKATRVGTQSAMMTRGAVSGRHGQIPSPRTRENPHSRKVAPLPFGGIKADRYRCVYARPPIAQSSTATPQKVIHAQVDEGEPEEGEAMEAVNDEDEDMMAMMGMTGFGSTKVLISLYICGSFFRLVLLEGPARRWKPRWCCQCQETANMETVHEQVCSVTIVSPPCMTCCLGVGDSTGPSTKSSSLSSHCVVSDGLCAVGVVFSSVCFIILL